MTASDRHGVPAMSTVSKPSRSGAATGVSGTSPARSATCAAVGDLRERAAAAQQRLGAAAAAPVAADRPAEDLVDALAQLAVELVAAVALDRPEQQAARQRAADRDGADRGQRDPRAQAARQPHGRRAQPTPRTVCRIRGSPAPSSLRRR